MFGSDRKNVTRSVVRTQSSVASVTLKRGSSPKCDKDLARNQGAQSQTSVASVTLKRGGSPAGCGRTEKDAVANPEGVLVGVSDTLAGGASQPGAPEFVPPPSYEQDVLWRDNDLLLVQDEDDAINVVDNA